MDRCKVPEIEACSDSSRNFKKVFVARARWFYIQDCVCIVMVSMEVARKGMKENKHKHFIFWLFTLKVIVRAKNFSVTTMQ